MRIGQVITMGLWASGFVGGSEALAQSHDADPGLTCLEQAKRTTSLGEGDAFLLCGGSSSTAPVECFERVEEAALLPTAMAMALCQCASSLAPVDCYTRLQRDTMLSKADIVALCAPAVGNRLWPQCPKVPPAY